MYTIGEDYIRLSSNISDTTSDIVKTLAVAFTTEVDESNVMNFFQTHESLCFTIFDPHTGKTTYTYPEIVTEQSVISYIVKAVDYTQNSHVAVSGDNSYFVWTYIKNSSGNEVLLYHDPPSNLPTGTLEFHAATNEIPDGWTNNRTIGTGGVGRTSFLSAQGTITGSFDPDIPQLTLAVMIYRRGVDNTNFFNRNLFIRTLRLDLTVKTGIQVDPWWMVPDFSVNHITPYNQWRFVAVVFDYVAGTRRLHTIPFSYTDESQMTDSTNRQTLSLSSSNKLSPITELVFNQTASNAGGDVDISNAYIIPAALSDKEVFDLFLRTKQIV